MTASAGGYANGYRTIFVFDNETASINLTLEQWSEDELEAATSVSCPDCGLTTRTNTLIIGTTDSSAPD